MMKKLTLNNFYSPGLISIVFVPLLCVYYLVSINAFKEYQTISLDIWNGKESAKNRSIGTHKFLESKTYETINFTGAKDDIEKLIQARKKVKQLILTEDQQHGVKFHFGQKSTYNTFVETINILIEEQAKVYIPYKNDIFFVNPKKQIKSIDNKKIKFVTCRCCFTINQEQDTKIDWDAHFKTLKRFSFPLLFFILMLYFGLKRK